MMPANFKPKPKPINTPFVFWTCPRGCNSQIVWNNEKTDAVCHGCGLRRTNVVGSITVNDTEYHWMQTSNKWKVIITTVFRPDGARVASNRIALGKVREIDLQFLVDLFDLKPGVHFNTLRPGCSGCPDTCCCRACLPAGQNLHDSTPLAMLSRSTLDQAESREERNVRIMIPVVKREADEVELCVFALAWGFPRQSPQLIGLNLFRARNAWYYWLEANQQRIVREAKGEP